MDYYIEMKIQQTKKKKLTQIQGKQAPSVWLGGGGGGGVVSNI